MQGFRVVKKSNGTMNIQCTRGAMGMKRWTRYTYALFAIGFGLSSIVGVVIEFQGVIVGVCGVASGICAVVNK
jgi:hypothetical protein